MMKPSGLICALLLAVPLVSLAQRRDQMIELQRDVATLQDQVRSLERSLNENVGRITALLQQTIDSVNKVNTSVAVLDSTMREREKNLAAPMAAAGTKVDQMSAEFQFLRTSVEDVNARLGRLERQLVDLSNTIKVMQAPPAPPPGSASLPAGLSADALYANAMRDKDSGNYDIALQEFNDYLRFFGHTETAPSAQYHIGEIHYNRKAYHEALDAFDLVLEKFPENTKTLDAMFMKGRTLVQLNQRNQAAEEFREVYRRAPRGSDMATKAAAQLKALGLSPTPAKKTARPAGK